MVLADLHDIAVAAPAAFLLGLIAGMLIRTRYKLTRTDKDGGG